MTSIADMFCAPISAALRSLSNRQGDASAEGIGRQGGRGPAKGKAFPWVACLVALGLGLRLYHYLRGMSLWSDEAMVVLSVLTKSFRGLLGPLPYYQTAPPLFLWTMRLVGLVFGDHPLAWRLLPFLAGCAGLLLMVPIAGRILDPKVVPWAILLIASSDRILYHASEVKPYVFDVLCATVLIGAHGWTGRWPLGRRLILFTGLAPPLIFSSYPGTFLCGGLLVALAGPVWREKEVGARLKFIVLTLIVVGSVATLVMGPIRAQDSAALRQWWLAYFPDWSRPWAVPGATVTSTLGMFEYCVRPTGRWLAPLAVVGAWALWREGKRSVVALLVMPMALGVVAAYLGRYPWGAERVQVYNAPAVVLLTAAGLAPAFAWLSARGRWRVAAQVALVLLLLAPLRLSIVRLVTPWEDRAWDAKGATAYVLSRLRPADAVTSNHVEFDYYFRRIGSYQRPMWRALPEGLWLSPALSGDRLWTLAVRGTPATRAEQLAQAAAGWWRIAERREFAGVSVFLLVRQRRPQAEPTAGGSPGPPRR